MLTLRGHSGPVLALAYSADGRLLASGSADRTVRVWDMLDRQELVAPFVHGHNVVGVAFAPDVSVVASVGLDRQVRLWDLTTGSPGTVLPPQSSVPTAVAFFPSGRSLAVAGGLITCVAISPDGKTVAAGSADPIDFRGGG